MSFTPITLIVNKTIQKSFEFILIINQSLRYVKTAKKVTKFTDPVKVTTYTASMLIELHGEKYAKYTVLRTV